MKKYRIISSIVLAFVMMFSLQSCFQDLDNDPDFDYPEMPDMNLEYSPLKLDLTVKDDKLVDAGIYRFQPIAYGKYTLGEGVAGGKAYQGSLADTYVLVNNHASVDAVMRDTMSHFKAFTAAFWINSPKEKGATGIFSIPNTKEFWGNFDIFQDNSGSETQAFYKMHLLNFAGGAKKEQWVEVRMDNAYDKWMHLAVTYDSKTSTLKVYRDGAMILEKPMPGMGEIEFTDTTNKMLIGTLQFQTTPSITSGATKQDWGSYFAGRLDKFKFYNIALSANAIKELYDNKK